MNGTQADDRATQIEIRQACSSDRDAIGDFLAGLSLRTRYLRFFAGVMPVTPAMLHRLAGGGMADGDAASGGTGGDHIDALLATEDGAIIGHAMAVGTRGSSGAQVTEIGVVVADARQGQGVGSALMRALAGRAQARGATVIVMDVLAENQETLAMITNHFPAARHHRSGPYVTIHVPLARYQEEQPREPFARTRQPQPCGQPGHDRKRHLRQRAAAGLPVG
ncbi:MAG TPA: GNAT family N-acetyltransferase [Streptosporangiaceae bacterium]|nr:GNAT family N-acetyltransferase [Streptosporangiaceae bacterium]